MAPEPEEKADQASTSALPADSSTAAADSAAVNLSAVEATADKEEDEDTPETTAEEPLFEYFLAVDKGLFGRLRMRCWVHGEQRPSVYSAEVKLPRFQGKEATKDTARKTLEEARQVHLLALNVPPRSLNAWGGEGGGSQGAPIKPTATDKASKKLAPVPYDVPMPTELPGLASAGARLAHFYIDLGISEGGQGLCFGLRIDHVMHALTNGELSAGVDAPLLCLLECAYKDVLLPMLDTVVVLKHEWGFVVEKVSGIVRSVCMHSGKRYSIIEGHLPALVHNIVSLYETMRQCEFEMLLSLVPAWGWNLTSMPPPAPYPCFLCRGSFDPCVGSILPAQTTQAVHE